MLKKLPYFKRILLQLAGSTMEWVQYWGSLRFKITTLKTFTWDYKLF